MATMQIFVKTATGKTITIDCESIQKESLSLGVVLLTDGDDNEVMPGVAKIVDQLGDYTEAEYDAMVTAQVACLNVVGEAIETSVASGSHEEAVIASSLLVAMAHDFAGMHLHVAGGEGCDAACRHELGNQEGGGAGISLGVPESEIPDGPLKEEYVGFKAAMQKVRRDKFEGRIDAEVETIKFGMLNVT